PSPCPCCRSPASLQSSLYVLSSHDVKEDRRCMVLVLLSVHPLHEVAERGRLSAVVGFPVGELLPIPILVALCARCHVLSPPGKHLVLVRNVLGEQKIEPGLAGLRITHSAALELLAYDFLANLDCRVLSHSLALHPKRNLREVRVDSRGNLPKLAEKFRSKLSNFRVCVDAVALTEHVPPCPVIAGDDNLGLRSVRHDGTCSLAGLLSRKPSSSKEVVVSVV